MVINTLPKKASLKGLFDSDVDLPFWVFLKKLVSEAILWLVAGVIFLAVIFFLFWIAGLLGVNL